MGKTTERATAGEDRLLGSGDETKITNDHPRGDIREQLAASKGRWPRHILLSYCLWEEPYQD